MKQEAMNSGNLEDPLTEKILGAAIRVHRELGPGFLESIYEEALAIAILYHEHLVGEHRLDFLVESTVVVELKAIAEFEKVHFAIVRSYLKAAGIQCGLLLNFAKPTLDIKRIGREFTGARRPLDLEA